MQWLSKCLESCKEYSVIIVDNASTDDTCNYIEVNYPNILLLKQNKNLGFGQANNIGISYALKLNADYVFLLNQDAYLLEGCIERLISIHKQHPKFGIISPIHLNGTGDRLDRNFSHYVNYKNNMDFYSDFILKKSLKDIYKVPFVNAAGWLLSRKILETVGGFDPIFFHYGEDENYCQRSRFHKFEIGVVPSAFLKHDREERNVARTIREKKSFWERNDRTIKIRWGDVNNSDLNKFDEIIQKKVRRKWLSLLTLDFNGGLSIVNEIVYLKSLKKDLIASRSRNIVIGRNYLK